MAVIKEALRLIRLMPVILAMKIVGFTRSLHSPDPWFCVDPSTPLCRTCTRGKKMVEWPCETRKELDQHLADLESQV